MNDSKIHTEIRKAHARVGFHIATGTACLFTALWISLNSNAISEWGILAPAILFGVLTGCVLRSGWLIFCAYLDMLVLYTKLGYNSLPFQVKPKKTIGRLVEQPDGSYQDPDKRPAIKRE